MILLGSVGEEAVNEGGDVGRRTRLRVGPVQRPGALRFVEPADLLEHAWEAPRLFERTGEDELTRIDPPKLDRPGHALVTAARIGWVEQAAAPGHQPDDSLAGALEALAERGRGDLEGLGCG